MKSYFQLQYKRTNRKFADFGIHPVLGYFLALPGFFGFSLYLFYKTEFAEYIYMLIAIGVAAQLGETKRNDFLKSCFSSKDYLKVRLVENWIAATPFLLFLASEALFVAMFIVITTMGLLAFFRFGNNFNIVIPTPFSKRPFEFSIGFRATFYLIAFAYFLTFMAVSVGNFNLGVFSLALVFLVALTFYTKPENEYFVWSFSMSPGQFLIHKIWTAIIHSTLLSMPVVVALLFFFFAQTDILLLIQLAGYAALTTIILAKYSAYPNPMNLPQILLVVICIQVPPVILIVIPIFYLQSVKRLNHILE